MVLPVAFALGLMAISALQGVWSVYSQSKKNEVSNLAYNYERNYALGYNSENARYWADYIRAHKIYKPVKYPFRSGMEYNLSSVYSADAGLNANRYSMYDSYFNAIASTARSGAYAYGYSKLKKE